VEEVGVHTKDHNKPVLAEVAVVELLDMLVQDLELEHLAKVTMVVQEQLMVLAEVAVLVQ
jgi:hypothetical protein